MKRARFVAQQQRVEAAAQTMPSGKMNAESADLDAEMKTPPGLKKRSRWAVRMATATRKTGGGRRSVLLSRLMRAAQRGSDPEPVSAGSTPSDRGTSCLELDAAVKEGVDVDVVAQLRPLVSKLEAGQDAKSVPDVGMVSSDAAIASKTSPAPRLGVALDTAESSRPAAVKTPIKKPKSDMELKNKTKQNEMTKSKVKSINKVHLSVQSKTSLLAGTTTQVDTKTAEAVSVHVQMDREPKIKTSERQRRRSSKTKARINKEIKARVGRGAVSRSARRRFLTKSTQKKLPRTNIVKTSQKKRLLRSPSQGLPRAAVKRAPVVAAPMCPEAPISFYDNVTPIGSVASSASDDESVLALISGTRRVGKRRTNMLVSPSVQTKSRGSQALCAAYAIVRQAPRYLD